MPSRARVAGEGPSTTVDAMPHDEPALGPDHRLALVVNPVKVDVGLLRSTVTTAESEHGWAPSAWFETDATDDGRGAARAARASGADVVLVAGGDGTLRIVAEELRGSGVAVALLPAGTGNLYARNLRIPLNDVRAAVRAAFTGTDRQVDVALAELTGADGTVARHAFLVMAGIGLDANMAANTSPRLKKRFGWVAYSDPIIRSVIGNRQIAVRYRLDDAPARTMQAHTVIVGNCGTLTAGVLLLPDARPDDGVLDAVAFQPKRAIGWSGVGYGLSLNRFFHRTRFGRLLAWLLPASKTLRYTSARSFDLALDAPEQVQLDGDPFGTVTAARITVDHDGLTIRVA